MTINHLSAVGVRKIPNPEATPSLFNLLSLVVLTKVLLTPLILFFVLFFGGLLAGAFGGSLQHRIVRHAGPAAAAQYQ